MKKSLLFILFVFVFQSNSISQITKLKIADKIDLSTKPYDSLHNFVGENVVQYIGQELYLNEKPESLREFGFEGFFTDYQNLDGSTDKVYKCCESYHSKYAELAGKYFTVLDVIKHPKSNNGNISDEAIYGSKSYLKLEDKSSKDTVYFEYDSQYEFTFPFIVVGHFDKMKKIYIGQQIVLRGRNWVEDKSGMIDIKTGLPVDFSAGSVWKTIDVTIEDKYFKLALIIVNNKGEQLWYPIDDIFSKYYFAFKLCDSEKYKSKYGIGNWQNILKGKVKIGMSKEMCLVSWGEPIKINQTITSGSKSEQYVYKDNFLYFANGILTAIQ